MSGAADARHFVYAIKHGYFLLSRDADDYRDLHDVVVAAGGHHPGILLVCEEKNKSKNMTPARIVAAIQKLLKTGVALSDQVHVLNQWR